MRNLLLLALLFPICAAAQSYVVATGDHSYARLSAPTMLAMADDELSTAIAPAGFAFEYFGASYTEFKIGSNGYLIMGSAGTTSGPVPFPSWTPGLTIAPLWRDLNASLAASGDGIGWEYAGGVLTVEWDEIHSTWGGGGYVGAGTYANMQVVLDTGDGSIEFRYGMTQKPMCGPPPIQMSWYMVHIAGPSGTGQEIINGECAGYITSNGEQAAYPANKFIRFEPQIAPQITSTPPTDATVGQPYAYTITVEGAPAPSLSVTGLPAWLSVSGSTISGTPAFGDLGLTGSITIEATNSVGSHVQQFNIDVQDSAPPPSGGNGGTGGGIGGGGGCAAAAGIAPWWLLACVFARRRKKA